ncbi:MAG: hypothetical protein QXN21_01800, partial [Candidatus Bathyarchaeia archaeon]
DMSEENLEEGFPERKVVLRNPENFQLQAAYLAYSEAYDNVDDSEVRKYLNQNMLDLQHNKIDYQTFYRNINQYRQISGSQCQSKSNIKSSSKSEWRTRVEKMEREKRHRK